MKYIKLFEKIDADADNMGADILKIIIDLLDCDEERIYAEIEKIRILISKGANVNYRDYYGTSLIWASYRGYYDIVKMLINAGANVNLIDDQGCSALIWVQRSSEIDLKIKLKQKLTDILINAGADWNIKDINDLDFIDYIMKDTNKELLLLFEKYPEQYEIYLMKKDANKYNL